MKSMLLIPTFLILTAQAWADASWDKANETAVLAFSRSAEVATKLTLLRSQMERQHPNDPTAFNIKDDRIETLVLSRVCTPGCQYRVVVRQFLYSPDDNGRIRSVSALVDVSVSESTKNGQHLARSSDMRSIKTDLEF